MNEQLEPAGPKRPAEARERLIIALDFPQAAPAFSLVDRLGDGVLWYKVGMELFYAEGRDLLRGLEERGKRIFLDLKLHDIPNTMAQAVKSLSRLPVDLTTLHIPAGKEAVRACALAATEASGRARGPLGLLGVTRLTSLPPPDPRNPWEDVLVRAGEGVEGGIFGWIAPVEAASALRARFGIAPALVCPGIRLPEQSRGDQVAVGTPEAAVRGGADWIVVGRPVTRAEDPAAAALEILRRLG